MTSYITSKQEFTESASTQDPTHLSERFAGSAYFHSSRRNCQRQKLFQSLVDAIRHLNVALENNVAHVCDICHPYVIVILFSSV